MKNKRIEAAEGSANSPQKFPPESLTRREFLELAGLALTTAACGKVVRTLETLTPTAAPKSTDTPKPPTSTPTESPTETPTTTPTEDPYRAVILTQEQLASMSDAEVRQAAPTPNITELGFPPGTQLVPEVVGRWGEGSNYVIYKNPATNDYELAWNPETGAVEHAIYAPAHEAEIAGERCTGIPLLIISDKTILAEDGGGGYFALNHEVIPDSQARVGQAFNSALAVYWWGTRGPGALDRRCLFDHGLPDFSEIPGHETLTAELEAVRDPNWWYDKASGPLRDRIVAFMRDKFLLTLNQKKQLGEPMDVTLKALRAASVDLTRQKVMVTRFVCTGDYQPTSGGIHDIFMAQVCANNLASLPFVEQTSNVNLRVDDVKYDVTNYQYGDKLTLLLRCLFGKSHEYYLPDYTPGYVPNPNSSDPNERIGHCSDNTTGFATILCPPDFQPPVIKEYYDRLFLPALTHQYSVRRPFPGQQSAVNFVTRAQ